MILLYIEVHGRSTDGRLTLLIGKVGVIITPMVFLKLTCSEESPGVHDENIDSLGLTPIPLNQNVQGETVSLYEYLVFPPSDSYNQASLANPES